MTLTIVALIALALLFDFLNGFHDSANAIATVVSTRVLSPKWAVLYAGFFDFFVIIFFWFFLQLTVANTVGKGIVSLAVVDNRIVFAALVGACSWNVITWYLGLPTSSSHALIGGLIGAALIKAGPGSLVVSGIVKTVSFIVISPVAGMVLGMGLGRIVFSLFGRSAPLKVDHIFRKGQLVSAALYSMGHGANDAQKTMGIIASLLFSAGLLGGKFYIPIWVIIACQLAIALGVTLGGWRIVKTMGQKVTKLRPVDGFCAETGAAFSLYVASFFGIPVSTTHTITGAIVGVGSIRRLSAVKWGVAGRIVWAWILTIPCAALVSAIAYFLVSHRAH